MNLPVVDCTEYNADKEQIVAVYLSCPWNEKSFNKMAEENVTRGIKCLLIEQYKQPLPMKYLRKNFQIVKIDLTVPELPAEIEELYNPEKNRCSARRCEAMEREAARLYEKQCLRDTANFVLLRVGACKPKKQLTEGAKYILKMKLEKYGTLDEVLEALQNN